jgi:hypothetical protein
VLILIVLYVCAYETLRATHVIAHYSNAAHPDPEKWQAGHYVCCDHDTIGAQLISIIFKPAMLIEEQCRNIADWWRGRAPSNSCPGLSHV